MLGKNSKRTKNNGQGKVDTLVGHQTEITGDIVFSGGLHVDGIVRGNVAADPDAEGATAVISERGRVEGELRVPSLLINGFVAGDVYATEGLELAPNARVRGDVYYTSIEMASGAEINGQLVRIEQEQRYLEHKAVRGEDRQGDARSASGPTPSFGNEYRGDTPKESAEAPTPDLEVGDKS